MIIWTDELFVLSHSFILHRNPGHNVKTTLIKTIVKVKVKVLGFVDNCHCLFEHLLVHSCDTVRSNTCQRDQQCSPGKYTKSQLEMCHSLHENANQYNANSAVTNNPSRKLVKT